MNTTTIPAPHKDMSDLFRHWDEYLETVEAVRLTQSGWVVDGRVENAILDISVPITAEEAGLLIAAGVPDESVLSYTQKVEIS